MNVSSQVMDAVLFFHANTKDKSLKEEFLRKNDEWFLDASSNVCDFSLDG